MALAAGTWVKFSADSRLRKITDKGIQEQKTFHEGVLIGENREGVVVQALGENAEAYTVIFPDSQAFGWCYSYELYAVAGKKPYPLKLQKV